MKSPPRPLPCIVFAVLFCALATSCASIITGSTDTVLVQSIPSGARFKTNTGERGLTPKTIVVPASVHLSIDFVKTGYEDGSALVKSRVSGWILGNFIFGSFIGLGVDLINPNARTHTDTVCVELSELDPESREALEFEREKARARTRREEMIKELPQEINISNW